MQCHFAAACVTQGGAHLRAVAIGPGVGHRKHPRPGVLQPEIFVLESLTIDGLAAGPVAVGEIATLQHELRDHAVKRGARVAEALLALPN